ncbi:tRNA 2-thiouridine(34) synthase MnmA [Rickettsiales endosymbiont of Stachyamoeba lipophora]|uniref:tRNA 2-thiouridine(34) synthase MnmA n=1 Tax=Rickettsiales endosymbiont of Stachyamoeba lipophora TaxID=2486578 RepID=UPI000F64B003|nr:tRNA 2-thiouridine(34) synthase MnmA [Rickettsiales endosymbiont of Stachyamoeba lipophora]AZL16217.1 tRNA 2-thiouridine(34) synthase MnmA [Rickettsiales endosymbiont of Stachyamoeba lipophora]
MFYSFNFNLSKSPQDTKVVVAMSGGVDSSTVAALLHELGYQVIGITLQLYDLGITLEKKGACCAGQDIYDAKMVADTIGFPHYVLNYESLFKESVINDFTESYLRGETPIPCVKCNQSVKFRDLLKVAKDLGADALATGHYIQKEYINNQPNLKRALDHSKDQSYFLFATTKEQLDFTYFPLGHLTKEETRIHAKRFNLITADKPDSQDICFVPNGDYANVIRKSRPEAFNPGNIVDTNGNIIAKHNGIVNYTIGQRRGLGIGGNERPLYVVKIDPNNNEVIVGPEEFLSKTTFTIRDINWIGEQDFANQPEFNAFIKLRSTHKGAFANIKPTSEFSAEVKLFSPERAITPGQACVFYDNDLVLGGGWINRN